MNCNEFDSILDRLASDGPLDSALRDRAQTHYKECEWCSMRLTDERVLNSALRLFKEETSLVGASAHLKGRLLESFEEQMNARNIPATIVEFPMTGIRGRRALITVIAASVIAILALTYQVWLPVLSSGNQEVLVNTPPPPNSVPVGQSLVNAPESEPEDSGDINNDTLTSRVTGYANSQRADLRAGKTVLKEAAMTEFIPLTYVCESASVKGGTIIRVEVEREALLALGVPAAAVSRDSLIKADLMLGDDGVARAIRFVQ